MTRHRNSLSERIERYQQSVMARRAESAAATPTTSSEAIESGVPTTDAPTTPVETSDSGKTPTPPTLARIKDGQGTVAMLAEWAEKYPDEMRAAQFVRAAFEEPYPPRLRKPSTERIVSPVEGGLRFWSVLAFAREWDEDGETLPSEFVEALACETTGHPKGDAVSSILRGLDDGLRSSDNDFSEQPDEWERFRYG